jgi:hypothetical protein
MLMDAECLTQHDVVSQELGIVINWAHNSEISLGDVGPAYFSAPRSFRTHISLGHRSSPAIIPIAMPRQMNVDQIGRVLIGVHYSEDVGLTPKDIVDVRRVTGEAGTHPQLCGFQPHSVAHEHPSVFHCVRRECCGLQSRRLRCDTEYAIQGVKVPTTPSNDAMLATIASTTRVNELRAIDL